MADDNAIEEKTISAKTTVPTKVDSVRTAVREAIDEHVATLLRNSNFSRDTPAWNHFNQSIPALVEGIVTAVKGV